MAAPSQLRPVRRSARLSLGALLSLGVLVCLPSPASAFVGTGQYVDDHTLAPNVVTGAPETSAGASVVLKASVDPNFQTTSVVFRWGVSVDQLTHSIAVPALIGGATDPEGSGPLPVTAVITGLTAGASYWVVADAVNGSGSASGQPVSFIVGAGADRTPPAATAVVIPRSRAKLISSGVRVKVTSDEPAGIVASVRDGKQLQLSRNVTGIGTIKAPGAASVFVALSARAKARLRQNRKIRWTVSVSVTDTAGNERIVTTPLSLN